MKGTLAGLDAFSLTLCIHATELMAVIKYIHPDLPNARDFLFKTTNSVSCAISPSPIIEEDMNMISQILSCGKKTKKLFQNDEWWVSSHSFRCDMNHFYLCYCIVSYSMPFSNNQTATILTKNLFLWIRGIPIPTCYSIAKKTKTM